MNGRIFPALLCFFTLSLGAIAQDSGPFLGGAWAGNVSPTSVTVAIRLNASGQRVRLQVSQSESLTPGVFSAAVTTAAGAGNAVKLTVQGLQADTEYYYGFEVGGVLRPEAVSRGRFRTFPAGRASFRIAFGSCSDFRLPDQRVFDAIREERPLLFIHMGDLHYIDTNTTAADEYRANYDRVLSHPTQGAFYRSLATAYMWDDHDFCGDDSDATAVGRDAARAVYRERVPEMIPTRPPWAAMQRGRFIGKGCRIIQSVRREARSARRSRSGACVSS
jgi:alkaline phosphatase D